MLGYLTSECGKPSWWQCFASGSHITLGIWSGCLGLQKGCPACSLASCSVCSWAVCFPRHCLEAGEGAAQGWHKLAVCPCVSWGSVRWENSSRNGSLLPMEWLWPTCWLQSEECLQPGTTPGCCMGWFWLQPCLGALQMHTRVGGVSAAIPAGAAIVIVGPPAWWGGAPLLWQITCSFHCCVLAFYSKYGCTFDRID